MTGFFIAIFVIALIAGVLTLAFPEKCDKCKASPVGRCDDCDVEGSL
jgi:hypothetical protein